jgi:uncharacterized protein
MSQTNKPSSLRNTIGLIILGTLMFGVVPWLAWEKHSVRRSAEEFLSVTLDRSHHFYDYAHIMPPIDAWGNTIQTMEDDLQLIQRESDIDLRIVLVKDTGGKSIEELAVEKVQAFGIGGNTREERGTLLLYDFGGRRLRVEVGYGLEGFFPDAFVSYLVHDHANLFFSSGNVSTGIRLLIRMLHHRIRQARLGNEFDPTVLNVLQRPRHLSGGAGASTAVPPSRQGDIFRAATREEREYYSAQPTPEATHEKYLEWLQADSFLPNVDLFTKDTQGFLTTLPMSKAYFHYILLRDYGKRYKVATRGDVAMLYYTDDPLLDPAFLVKHEKGWQLDFVGSLDTIMAWSGDEYTWSFTGRNDVYNRAFAGQLVKLGKVIRIADGDNRKLPVRGPAR